MFNMEILNEVFILFLSAVDKSNYNEDSLAISHEADF